MSVSDRRHRVTLVGNATRKQIHEPSATWDRVVSMIEHPTPDQRKIGEDATAAWEALRQDPGNKEEKKIYKGKKKLLQAMIVSAADVPVGTLREELPIDWHTGNYGLDLDELPEDDDARAQAITAALEKLSGLTHRVAHGESTSWSLWAVLAGPVATTEANHVHYLDLLKKGLPEEVRRLVSIRPQSNHNTLRYIQPDRIIEYNPDFVPAELPEPKPQRPRGRPRKTVDPQTLENPTPDEWLERWPQHLSPLVQKGKQWQGPCPSCDEGDDRFHVKAVPPYLFGCRSCIDPETGKMNMNPLVALFPERRPSRGSSGAVVSESPLAAKDGPALFEALRRVGMDIRLNIRSLRMEVRPISPQGESLLAAWGKAADIQPNGWVTVKPTQAASLRGTIAREVSYLSKGKRQALRFQREQWREAALELSATCYGDPFEEWTDTHPQWDAWDRMAEMLTEAMGVSTKEHSHGFLSHAGRLLVLPIVGRLYTPGVEASTMTVLIGPEGVGKSLFIKFMFPPEWQSRWFTDSISLDVCDKELLEKSAGFVMLEISELAGMFHKEIERVKARISSTQDVSRLAFREDAESFPRRFWWGGTANDEGVGVLPDSATNRRFWPVNVPASCTSERVMSWWEANRDQVWAQAVHEVRELGLKSWLNPKELEGERLEAARSQRRIAPGTGDLVEIVEGMEDLVQGHTMAELLRLTDVFGTNRAEFPDHLTLAEVSGKITAGPGKNVAMNLAAELKSRGWVNRQGNPNRGRGFRGTWFWFPPGDSELESVTGVSGVSDPTVKGDNGKKEKSPDPAQPAFSELKHTPYGNPPADITDAADTGVSEHESPPTGDGPDSGGSEMNELNSNGASPEVQGINGSNSQINGFNSHTGGPLDDTGQVGPDLESAKAVASESETLRMVAEDAPPADSAQDMPFDAPPPVAVCLRHGLPKVSLFGCAECDKNDAKTAEGKTNDAPAKDARVLLEAAYAMFRASSPTATRP